MGIKIGGEFEITPNLIHGFEKFDNRNDSFLFSSGRAALMQILKIIKTNTKTKSLIYLPYYICSSVVEVCKKQKYNIRFYELDQNFLFNIDYLEKIETHSVLLTLNYFGFVNDNYIVQNIKNKRPDITTISDNVQSLQQCSKSLADFSFTSLRKHLPVPDGALLYSKGIVIKPENDLPENSFFNSKLLGSIAKYNNEKDHIYLNHFEEGEKLLANEKEITKASRFSEYTYQNYDFKKYNDIREENYFKVYELGSKIGLNFIFPYTKGITPLCVPILLEKRNDIRKKLFKRNIFLPIHWPLDYYNENSELSNKMAKHELSLLIDHRYSLNEIEYQLNELKKHL